MFFCSFIVIDYYYSAYIKLRTCFIVCVRSVTPNNVLMINIFVAKVMSLIYGSCNKSDKNKRRLYHSDKCICSFCSFEFPAEFKRSCSIECCQTHSFSLPWFFPWSWSLFLLRREMRYIINRLPGHHRELTDKQP